MTTHSTVASTMSDVKPTTLAPKEEKRDTPTHDDDNFSILSFGSTLSSEDKYPTNITSPEFSQHVYDIVSKAYDIPLDALKIICPSLACPKVNRTVRQCRIQTATNRQTEDNEPVEPRENEIPVKIEAEDESLPVSNSQCICNCQANGGDLVVISNL